MEIRLGAEVGLKKAASMGIPETKTKTENYANLPGKDVNNRQAHDTDRAAAALKPTEMKAQFKLLGNTINIQA